MHNGGDPFLDLRVCHTRRLAAKFLTDLPKSVDRGVKHLEPIIRERYAMMEKYGDDWSDKPVGGSTMALVSPNVDGV